MRSRRGTDAAIAFVAVALLGGCSAGPAPQGVVPPAQPGLPSDPATGFTGIVRGAEDSVAALPGSPDALFRYRFRGVYPANDRFTLQDRELSFYFRPSPEALHFKVENRQDRSVWIEWDRSVFYDPLGRSGKVAHATTRWQDRFGVQPPTEIIGLQSYGDYLLPLEYLLDPAGEDEQLHRPLFPEDSSAPQYTGREFGVDLVFRMGGGYRTYPVRFRVASVIPR